MKNIISERLAFIGKSQGWLSIRSKTGRSHLNKIIKRKIEPKVSTADRIAKALQCRIEDIFIFKN